MQNVLDQKPLMKLIAPFVAVSILFKDDDKNNANTFLNM